MLGDHARDAAFGRVDLDAYGIVAVAGVTGGLINAYGKASGDGGDYFAASADGKRLRGVLIADAPDERAASGCVKRQHAEKVLEAAGEAFGAVVIFRVRIMEFASGSDQHVFAGLNVDTSIDPGFIASELNFLG